MKSIIQLDSDVHEILSRSIVDGTILRLPPEKLQKKLYARVNQALEALGGKWDRKLKGHVFATDPSAPIASATGDGHVVKSVVDPNPLSFFPTSPELADQVAERLQARPTDRILEPSAGDGALVRAILRRLNGHRPAILNLTLVEIDPGRFSLLRQDFDSSLFGEDFLEMRPSEHLPFHRIAMNPPFENEGDARHIGHALDFLAPGGRLVAIAGFGFEFRRTRKLTIGVRERVLSWGGTIERLPEDAFKRAGTAVQTVLVTVDRPRAS